MPHIVWTEEFSVGNEKIDAQHKKWVDIYNDAHDKMLGGKSNYRRIATDSLKQILEYTHYHFESEENWMREIGYEKFEDHRAIHEDFLKKVERIRQDFENNQPMLNSELIKLMENWLTYHILNEDKKIMPAS